MKNNSEKLTEEFNNKIYLYKGLAERTNVLLNSLVRKKINPHQINYRIKDKESFLNKLIRKNYKYSYLEEITDILGFRLITYFEDDIRIIESLIKNEFKIDKKNSVDKRNLEIDKFGYRSVHFVVSLSDERLKLPEYIDYKNLKFEIQIRSILQHSWAEIEHDIGYKGANEIPSSAKRTFYRVAALLEQADIEFTKLRYEINEYEKNIEKDIIDNKPKIPLNKSSLIVFIKNNKTIKEIENEVENRPKFYISKEINTKLLGSDELLKDLHDFNITSVNELENSLIENRKNILKDQEEMFNFYERNDNYGSMTFIKGAPILWLISYLKNK